MLATWGSDMERRPGQRASAKLGVVCREVSTMVEAQTNEPPLVPLSWVGYRALALVGGGCCACRLGALCPTLGGGGFLEKSKWGRRGS